MIRRPSKAVIDAINVYYEHRRKQEKYPWNKAADLKAIGELATAEGWQVEATAGTFWFKMAAPDGRLVLATVKEHEGLKKARVITSMRNNLKTLHESECLRGIELAMKAHDRRVDSGEIKQRKYSDR